MTYSVGSLILASDFNTFRTQVNDVFADNNSNATSETVANFGYGQTPAITSVAFGEVITASQWSNLLDTIHKTANHQGTLISIPTFVSVGNLIEVLTALTSNITDIRNNRLNVAPGSVTITSGGTRLSTSRTTSWSSQVNHEWTVTFPSYDAMRYFFNTGGQIRASGSRTGGTSSPQNTNWSNLLSGMGTVIMDHAQTTATGTGSTTSIGFYNLTTAFQTIFSRSGTSAYTANQYRLRARLNNALGPSATQIIMRAEFIDGHTSSFSDVVSGTLTHRVDERRATNATNVSVPQPTYANSVLL